MMEAAALIADRDRPGFETTTPERSAKAGADGMEMAPPSQPAPKGRQRVIDTPLARLWAAKVITGREHQAGETYCADAYLSAIDPAALTVDWNRAGGGGTSNRTPSMFSSQMIADARIRWRRLEDKIPKHSTVSVILFLALVKEQSFEKIGQSVLGIRDVREAHVSGKAAMRVALASLADVYRS